MIKKCSEMREEETGIIKNITLEEKKKFKLSHFGLLKEEEITCKFKSLMKSPIAYQINGCVFAIRKDDADQIEVEV